MPNETFISVRYYETDASGAVHHSNFLGYFELARNETMRLIGVDYADVHRTYGLVVVVGSGTQSFRKPAYFGDSLCVRTWLRQLGRRSLSFEYEVMKDDVLIAEGTTGLVCLKDGSPHLIPQEVVDLLLPHVEPRGDKV